MQAGLIAAYQIYEMRVDMGAAISDVGADSVVCTFRATIESRYSPNSSQVVGGLRLDIESVHDPVGGDTHSVRFQCPALGVDATTGALAGLGAATTSWVELANLKLYCYGGEQATWRLKCDSVKWYVNGGLQATYAGLDEVSTILTPCSVPIIGIPPTLTAFVALPALFINNWPSETFATEVNAVGTCTASKGWRFKIGGTWYAPPVTVDVLAPPIGDEACTVSTDMGNAGATSTYDGSVTSESHLRFYTLALADRTCGPDDPGFHCVPPGSTYVGESTPTTYGVESSYALVKEQGASITLLPCLPKRVTRMNANYAAMILRGGFPYADQGAVAECENQEKVDTCTDPEIETYGPVPIYSRKAQAASDYLGIPLNAVHAIEDPMNEATIAPYGVSGTAYELKNLVLSIIIGGLCDSRPVAGTPACCYTDPQWERSYAAASTFPYGGFPLGPVFAALRHSGDANSTLVNYINFNANPHWSYFYYFPVDADPQHWLVNGAKQFSEAYWLPLREQYLYHQGVPASRLTRNSMVSMPGIEGGLAAFIKSAFTGIKTSWWGITRFQPSIATPAATGAPGSDSTANWTATNCTKALGATTITLTPTGGATSLTLDYDIGQPTKAPYYYPHIAGSIQLAWPAGNISAMSVYVVNQAGDEFLLGTVAGTYAMPTVADTKFAGSWATSHIADTGTDIGAAGVSAASMGDVERNLAAFLLCGGWQAATLRYKITVTSSASTCQVTYPVFILASGNNRVRHEGGTVENLLYPNGPGLRLGQWTWGGGPSNAPSLLAIYAKQSVLDWLCNKREIFLGTERLTGTGAEAATLYDAVELGNAFSDPALTALDTIAFMVDASPRTDVTAMCVNSLAEVPPLACFPRRTRTATYAEDYSASGSWVQESFALDQEPRIYVAPQNAMQLKDSGGTQWTTGEAADVPGWLVSRHSHPVTNNEGITAVITSPPNGDFANVAPWHGYFAVLGQAPLPGEGVKITLDRHTNLHFIAFGAADGIRVEVTNWETEDAIYLAVASTTATNPSILWIERDALLVAYQDGSHIWAVTNYAKGIEGKWSTPMDLGFAGTNPELKDDPKLGIILLATHDGTNFVLRRWQKLEDLIAGAAAEGPYVIAAAPAGGIGIQLGTSGKRGLVAKFKSGGGNLNAKFSYDHGSTWS